MNAGGSGMNAGGGELSPICQRLDMVLYVSLDMCILRISWNEMII